MSEDLGGTTVLGGWVSMGTGDMLKRVIRPAAKQVSLHDDPDALRGVKVGVEIAGWLHRSCYCGAKEIVLHGFS